MLIRPYAKNTEELTPVTSVLPPINVVFIEVKRIKDIEFNHPAAFVLHAVFVAHFYHCLSQITESILKYLCLTNFDDFGIIVYTE